MNTKTKVWSSIIIVVVAILTYSFMSPVASLLSNAATVGQLANSDAASLATYYIGNGIGTLIQIYKMFKEQG